MDIKLNKRFEWKNLPDMKSLRSDIAKLQSELELGETLFFKKHGVKTEGEFKRRVMASKERYFMKHSHIGYNTWDTTRKAAEEVYTKLQERGSYVDRFGFCLDNLMGLPEKWRDGQLQGTGLIFKNVEEWSQIGQIVPVQPHCGDMMIGTLNSLENAMNALRAGVTTIGNASHYYTYEWPGLDEEEYRVIDMVKAIGVTAKYHDEGVILHSNLDDGYGGQLYDVANLVGWSKIERYYVEELLGGPLGHCYGNLFSNPTMRIIFNLAIWEFNTNNIPGSMVYGNTTEYGFDFEKNCGALSSYIAGDIIAQDYQKTGHAIVPIPVSEAARIPTPDEMVQAHMIADMMIKKAPCMAEYLDWNKILAEKELLVNCGNLFFERVMNGLDDLGVDTQHPGEIIAAIKAIGPAQLETVFGVGRAEKEALRGRVPVRPTNAITDLKNLSSSFIDKIDNLGNSLEGVKIIICTTDVHEYGKLIIKDILAKTNATIFDLGTSIGTTEVLDAVIETEANIIMVSTYNGIAYSYGKELMEGLKSRGITNAGVIMGGLINEDLNGDELAEDVSAELKALGIHADNNAGEVIEVVKEMYIKYNS